MKIKLGFPKRWVVLSLIVLLADLMAAYGLIPWWLAISMIFSPAIALIIILLCAGYLYFLGCISDVEDNQ